MRHGTVAGIVAAYGMYEECYDGELDPEGTILPEERMDYSDLLLNHASQILNTT